MEIGIQVSSLKPLLMTPEQVDTAFEKLRDLGFCWAQLQWIDPSVSPERIARSLQQTGIRSVSVQDFYETVRENLEAYRTLNAQTGGKWLCVSRIPQRLKSRQGLEMFAEELAAMQKTLDAWGQTLCFHPVSDDYTALPEADAVGDLLERLPDLPLCLDLYHLNRCCRDMPGYIRRYAGRICMVHFKDSLGGTLVPAGQGDTDWSGVVKACLDAGVEYGFVEQERWQGDPYRCLKEAKDWLAGQIDREATNPN